MASTLQLWFHSRLQHIIQPNNVASASLTGSGWTQSITRFAWNCASHSSGPLIFWHTNLALCLMITKIISTYTKVLFLVKCLIRLIDRLVVFCHNILQCEQNLTWQYCDVLTKVPSLSSRTSLNTVTALQMQYCTVCVLSFYPFIDYIQNMYPICAIFILEHIMSISICNKKLQ